MKATGEVMGIAAKFGHAYAKDQLGAGQRMPTEGTVFISVQDGDKAAVLPIAARFHEIGFKVLATDGTARFLQANGVPGIRINKVSEGRPHIVDAVKNGEVQFVINTGEGEETREDGYRIRRAAIKFSIP